jgi:SAM-dependent methyltransferase
LATLAMQVQESNNSTEYLEKYWSDYYQTPGALEEWYCEFDDLREYLPFLKNVNMMVIGPGLSAVPAYMVNKYAKHVVAVDVSSYVVHNMKELFKEIPAVEYIEMDVLSDEFGDAYQNQFEFIMEKAVFDTILLNDTTSADVVRLGENVYNALKPGGTFMMVTVLDLHAVKEIFVYQDWVIEYVGSKKMAGVIQDGQGEIHFIRLRK